MIEIIRTIPTRVNLQMPREKLLQILNKSVNYTHRKIRLGTVRVDDTAMLKSSCLIDATGDVTIGAQSMIGHDVILYTHDHKINGREPLLVTQEREGIEYRNKVIEKDVWINSRSIILMKCERIADGVIIGAGSVVTRSIDAAYTIWAGNPARKMGERK